MNRRGFISGLFAAPAIVKIGSIMPIKALALPEYGASPGILTLEEYARRLPLRLQQAKIVELLCSTNDMLATFLIEPSPERIAINYPAWRILNEQ